ncbi:hypothetical protein, partial [uncultured Flavonifractor sp.]|uniref:hypothetical protein n=1 Tax=uncultured Flavonifractor sp. TaxID=1193534 RepID=UPI00266E9FF4
DLLNAIQALSQLSYTPIFTWRRSGRPNELYFSTGHPLCQLFFHFSQNFLEAESGRAMTARPDFPYSSVVLSSEG